MTMMTMTTMMTMMTTKQPFRRLLAYRDDQDRTATSRDDEHVT